jgi:hypothetical protein
MATDWTKPTTASLYANFVTELDVRLMDLAKGLDPATTAPTGLPTNSIRWSSSAARWEIYNGTTWATLAATHAISVTGNAGTVTNGVVTTGAYANPTWITSLAWGKLTGMPTTIAGYSITDAPTKTGTGASGNWGIDITGNAATATSAVTCSGNAATATNASTSTNQSGGTCAATSYRDDAGNLIISNTNPTILSGFGASSTIVANHTAAFKITCGSGSGPTGSITMPAAPNGWVCHATRVNFTNAERIVQTIVSNIQIGLYNMDAAGNPVSFGAGNIILCQCTAF